MSNFNSENDAILAVVNKYFEGVSTVKPELITEAFAIEPGHLKCIAVDENGTESVKVEAFADARERWAGGSATEATGIVESIDVIDGKLAIVKFDLTLGQARFLDVLSLYKLNSEWQIVNKMFVLR